MNKTILIYLNISYIVIYCLKTTEKKSITNAPRNETLTHKFKQICWKVRETKRNLILKHVCRTIHTHTQNAKIPEKRKYLAKIAYVWSRIVLGVPIQLNVVVLCCAQKSHSQLFPVWCTTTVVTVIYVGFSHFPSKLSWEKAFCIWNKSTRFSCNYALDTYGPQLHRFDCATGCRCQVQCRCKLHVHTV